VLRMVQHSTHQDLITYELDRDSTALSSQRQCGGRRGGGQGLFEDKLQPACGIIQRHGEIFEKAPTQNPINQGGVWEGR
jgi:hypothetical protein